MNIYQSNILISGGSSGIGSALAKEFFLNGANVTILARNKAKLQETCSVIAQHKQSDTQVIDWITANVSNYKELESAFHQHGKNYDILINSAGLSYPGKFTDLSVDIHRQLIEVNYLGTVNLTKLVLPHMIAQKNGYIVNISSLAGLVGIFGYTAYAPTKYAIRGFTKCLRAEVKSKGVNISIVFPPDTNTPQLAFERSIMPEITKKINQGGGMMSAEKVAKDIITGMKKKKFSILPGIEGKIIYLFAPVIDRFLYLYAVHLSKKNF